jgi:hypothetical protein
MSRDAGIENTLWIRIAYLKSATEALRNEAEHITPESLQKELLELFEKLQGCFEYASLHNIRLSDYENKLQCISDNLVQVERIIQSRHLKIRRRNDKIKQTAKHIDSFLGTFNIPKVFESLVNAVFDFSANQQPYNPKPSLSGTPQISPPDFPPYIFDFSMIVDRHARNGGSLGIAISNTFTAYYLNGVICWVAAYFMDESGQMFKDTNERYKDRKNGYVTSGKMFTPKANQEHFNFYLFLPYDELHLRRDVNRTYYIRPVVKIFDKAKRTPFLTENYTDFIKIRWTKKS